jgi:hypothetical protein
LYQKYRTGKRDEANIDPYLRQWGLQTVTSALINCILEATPQIIQARSASAQVLLGLTPSILSTIGSGMEELSMFFITARRPLLGFLLAAGSPAVFSLRTFQYRSPTDALKEHSGVARFPTHNPVVDTLITVVEYVMALGAITNVALLSYDLGVKSFAAYSLNSEYLIGLWSFIGVVIQLLGAYSFSIRARNKAKKSSKRVLHWLRRQFTSMDRDEPVDVHLVEVTFVSMFLSWLTTVLTTLHLIFGTITFSSLLFISVDDALGILGRFMASVLVCRMILVYELSHLRVNVIDDADKVCCSHDEKITNNLNACYQ